MNLHGLRIVENANLTVPGTPYQVRRTWCERLFSRPWTPLTAERTVVLRIPSRQIYALPGGLIVMHPAMAAEIRKLVPTP